jgi:hypothetical protein
MMKRITPVAFAAAMGLSTLATPASATLQIYIDVTVGATSSIFTCSWSQACNVSGTSGLLQINQFTMNGVTIGGEVAASSGTPANPGANYLYSSILAVHNTNNQLAHITILAADTSFTAPIWGAQLAGSATFHNSIGSNFSINWFADAANGQGGGVTGSTPGALIGTYTSPTITSVVEGVSYTSPILPVTFTAPYSLTEETTYTLRPQGFLIDRSQTVVLGIPETSTWTMMLAGFAAIGFAGYRSSRKRAAQSV